MCRNRRCFFLLMVRFHVVRPIVSRGKDSEDDRQESGLLC